MFPPPLPTATTTTVLLHLFTLILPSLSTETLTPPLEDSFQKSCLLSESEFPLTASFPVPSLLGSSQALMEGFSVDFPGSSDDFSANSGFGAIVRGGSSSSSLLVLDSERGELVTAPARLGPNEMKAEKAMVALKNHSEAERRRRGRINAHLATLRGIIPGTKKMDKASLLGEVVSHLKELKRTATDISKGFLIPMDIDEVRVEQQEGGLDGAPYSIKASLCCDYKPGVLSDLRHALDTLHLKTVHAEIATLGGRMKNVFVMTGCKEGNLDDTEMRKLHANSVHQALRSVLDKFPASQDISSRSTASNKRQRISIFNSSSSSPFGDFW